MAKTAIPTIYIKQPKGEMKLTLEDIKTHLIIEDNADDLYLLQLEQAAEEAVTMECNVPSIDCLCDADGDLFDTARHAILLLIGTWYANRESVTYGTPNEIPQSYKYLCQLNQNYYGNGFYRNRKE